MVKNTYHGTEERIKGLYGEFAPLMSASYDSVFDAIVEADWNYGSVQGSLESPTGRFTRILVEYDDFNKNNLYSMRNQIQLDESLVQNHTNVPQQGWYLWQSVQVLKDAQPITWVFELTSRYHGFYLHDRLVQAFEAWSAK